MNLREKLNDFKGGPRRWGKRAALVGSGVILGGALMAGGAASAASPADPTTSATDTAQGQTAPRDESKPQRSDEKLLAGDTATKVKAAALAKYPDATIIRLETDSDGVYEAHLTTAAGKRVTVEVGKDFAVTGEEAGGAPGGGRGAPGAADNAAPASPAA